MCVCGQVCDLRMKPWDGSAPWHLHDLSIHIQPLVEIYRVPVVCISTTTARNLAVVTQKKNAAKASDQTVMGTWDHLLCTSFKKLIFIFYSQENYSMCAFFLSFCRWVNQVLEKQIASRRRWIWTHAHLAAGATFFSSHYARFSSGFTYWSQELGFQLSSQGRREGLVTQRHKWHHFPEGLAADSSVRIGATAGGWFTGVLDHMADWGCDADV